MSVEQQLREAMTAATSSLTADPQTVARARRAGARRRAARRSVVGTLTVLALAGSTLILAPGVSELRGGGSTSQALNAVLRHHSTTANESDDALGRYWWASTRGDLAGDASFTQAALTAWAEDHGASPNASRGIFDDLVGAPRVLWAGATPAGPAAIVAQQSYLHHHADIQLDHEGVYTLIGFVGTGQDGKAHLVTDTYQAPGSLTELAGMVSTIPPVALVLDPGVPAAESSHWTYTSSSVGRDWSKPLPFLDGVAVLDLTGADPAQVRLGKVPFTGFTDLYDLVHVPSVGSSTTNGGDETHTLAGWVTRDQLVMRVGKAGWPTVDAAGTEQAQQILTDALRAHIPPAAFLEGFSSWFVAGTLPDGRHLVVGEHSLDSDPAHLYAALSGPAGTAFVVGGAIDPTATIPVAIRLPDHQGWVLASHGHTLRWRLPGQSWSQPTANAVLTEDAPQLEVEIVDTGKTVTVGAIS